MKEMHKGVIMAKSLIGAKQAKAAAARARMAKRAKRQRWLKENKKRITIGVFGLVGVAFLAIFTPWGPEFYYNEIQLRKMESPDAVSPGTLKDLYGLGVFYHYSMRSKAAMEMYDEIAQLYFGFKLNDYALDPDAALEKQRQAEINKKKGTFKGPPFKIADIDTRYVGLAIWRYGEILQKERPRQFTYRIYKDLYLGEFAEKHPGETDPKVSDYIQTFVDKVERRR